MSLFDDFFDVLPRTFYSAPPLLRRGMNTNASYNSLPLNVSTTSTHYIVRTELPGIPQNQISVEITEDGVLSIQAERHSKDEKEKVNEENEIIKESWVAQGKLYRSLKFSKDNIDVDGIKAELNNGELIIKVPKKKSQQEEKEKKKIVKIIKGKL